MGGADDPLAIVDRRVRARTLVLLRWMAVAGQASTVLFVQFVLGFDVALAACLAVIAPSAWLNIYLTVGTSGQRFVSDGEAALQLAYDITQLACLVALTGGLNNPFAVLLGVPVMIASTALRLIWVIALAALALVSTCVMALAHLPLPWEAAHTFDPPKLYEIGLLTALVSGAAFMSVVTWRLARDARAMSTALAATQLVLSREQRLSALGGLAAAAAHELGTPLGTIQVVAKELARAATPGTDLSEDAALLVQQAERCRDILRQLGRRGDAGDQVHARISLQALLEEVAEPLRAIGPEIDITLEPVDADAPPPQLWRAPEMLYAIGNYAENAIDYAAARVALIGRWGADWIEIEVADDGPGFPPEILSKLGEPYVTQRAGEDGRGGLGLGFFIAKTFVERLGGRVEFGNRRPPRKGAVVRARWPLANLAAPGPERRAAAAAARGFASTATPPVNTG